jgi:hypothetical protein
VLLFTRLVTLSHISSSESSAVGAVAGKQFEKVGSGAPATARVLKHLDCFPALYPSVSQFC